MNNKKKVFLLSFLIYASVHAMRMTYSFNKVNIKSTFGINSFFLGIMDSFLFIALSIGTFFRYSILKNNNIPLICLKTSIPAAIVYSFIPLTSLIIDGSYLHIPSFIKCAILIISILLFGICQLSFFPALLTIFSRYFNVKQQGSLVGFWSSKGNVGNVVGFFMANFLVFTLHKKWEVSMILSSIFLLISTLSMNFVVKDIQQEDSHEKQITTSQFIQFLKNIWKTLQFKLYIFSFSFFKAILYSYQLWTPSFLSYNGYSHLSGYVPMIFDISALLGSYLMGKLYQQKTISEDSRLTKFLKKQKFFISSIIIILVACLYVFSPANIVIYFILAIIMGIFLGGVYNALENNQILKYTNNDSRKTDMLSTINIAVGCGLVAIFQIIIGVILHLQTRTNVSLVPKGITIKIADHGMIYVAIAIFGIISMILTFLRTKVSSFEHKPQEMDKQFKLQVKKI